MLIIIRHVQSLTELKKMRAQQKISSLYLHVYAHVHLSMTRYFVVIIPALASMFSPFVVVVVVRRRLLLLLVPAPLFALCRLTFEKHQTRLYRSIMALMIMRSERQPQVHIIEYIVNYRIRWDGEGEKCKLLPLVFLLLLDVRPL